MTLKSALLVFCLSVLTFDLCAQDTVVITTLTPAQQGVVDAKPATIFPKYLKECNFDEGDSLEKVKQFYGIDSEPHFNKEQAKYKKATAYTYYFNQYGVWVFFDANKKVQSLRFNSPFAGTVAGVAIGDASEQIVKHNGNPFKKTDMGLYDYVEYREREKKIDGLLSSLPDPAPKAKVLQVIDKIQAIRNKALVRTKSWLYKSDSGEFFRYNVSPVDDQVRYMFANSCNSLVSQ